VSYTTACPHDRRTPAPDESGRVRQPGVWNVEQLKPDPFMADLNAYGIAVGRDLARGENAWGMKDHLWRNNSAVQAFLSDLRFIPLVSSSSLHPRAAADIKIPTMSLSSAASSSRIRTPVSPGDLAQPRNSSGRCLRLCIHGGGFRAARRRI